MIGTITTIIKTFQNYKLELLLAIYHKVIDKDDPLITHFMKESLIRLLIIIAFVFGLVSMMKLTTEQYNEDNKFLNDYRDSVLQQNKLNLINQEQSLQ